ncbi:16S rRNA (guanine(527)-N(7))-methyltransferase RsmG [Helicobacter muridarum]|uniref:Ribosomal RNA small subunit methyltransferase G n=1 Tax=Helicobacter muridarum TaxID=216 RepID=A0A377PWD8_9HELI|nr:16S rRNA (guanine(527)-N(7))-methyltransferase RsmG [Helicobacter muridarum]STQ86955.1 glucose-inhibited division protein B [Helicobacter muridarum]
MKNHINVKNSIIFQNSQNLNQDSKITKASLYVDSIHTKDKSVLLNTGESYNLSNECISRLDEFCSVLLHWNTIHNLTGAKNTRDIQIHINDSLYPLSFLQPFDICVDIGSGAGFPAIALACHCLDSHFYLIEPRKKKAAFLQYVISRLRLSNAKVIADFSYNISSIGDFGASLITSRAVCDGHSLVKGSKHLLANNGKYLLFKGTSSIQDCEHIEGFLLQRFYYKQRIYAYLHSK